MAGVGDNECVLCNNDTSFMIIGLIPNLLAPLFVLQNEKKRRKKKGEKKKKGEGKEAKGGFLVLWIVPGSPKCLPAKGAGSRSISRGFAGTREGLGRGLAAAVAMVMDGGAS